MNSLESAALRRFLFKVKFLPMRRMQARETLHRHFGCYAPGGLDNLEMLAPGDFAIVARKVRLLDCHAPDALLAAEVAVKAGAVKQRVGF